MVRPIPEGFHSVTPYLTVDDANAAFDFWKNAFGAEEVMRLPMGDKIAHAEVKVGDSHIMFSDEWPDMGKLGPKSRGGATASLMVYVPDCDAAFTKAVDAGAEVEDELSDKFWGDRSGSVKDPFGITWMLATHKEELTPEEIGQRMQGWVEEMQQQEGQPEPA